MFRAGNLLLSRYASDREPRPVEPAKLDVRGARHPHREVPRERRAWSRAARGLQAPCSDGAVIPGWQSGPITRSTAAQAVAGSRAVVQSDADGRRRSSRAPPGPPWPTRGAATSGVRRPCQESRDGPAGRGTAAHLGSRGAAPQFHRALAAWSAATSVRACPCADGKLAM